MQQPSTNSSEDWGVANSDQRVGNHPWWDARTLLSNIPLVAKHPSWVWTYLRAGRSGVLRRIVLDSLISVRSQPAPENLKSLANFPLKTPLGRIGAPQELLYHVVRLTRPSVLVETGVYWGISSAFLLAALHDNGFGHLYSVDLPGGTQEPLRPGESTGFVVPRELRDRWTLRFGAVRTVLPELMKTLPSVDLYYHDADHRYQEMTWEFNEFLLWSAAGSLLLADDIDANTAFFDFMKLHPESVQPIAVLARRLGILKRLAPMP